MHTNQKSWTVYGCVFVSSEKKSNRIRKRETVLSDKEDAVFDFL